MRISNYYELILAKPSGFRAIKKHIKYMDLAQEQVVLTGDMKPMLQTDWLAKRERL